MEYCNKTNSGTTPKPGRTVAVDKKCFPHGSCSITINEIEYVAEDTGGDIKGRHIDIFFSNYSEALKNTGEVTAILSDGCFK